MEYLIIIGSILFLSLALNLLFVLVLFRLRKRVIKSSTIFETLKTSINDKLVFSERHPRLKGLTPFELEVINYSITGLEYKEVGAVLYKSPKTISNAMNNILSKTNCKNQKVLMYSLFVYIIDELKNGLSDESRKSMFN